MTSESVNTVDTTIAGNVDWSALFGAHVSSMQQRFESALARNKFDAAVIYAGSPHMQFLDDMSYPFKTNPHFKAWAPLTDVPESFVIVKPGERPALIYYQPDDYWHKPPDDPEGFWAGAFDIHVIGKPGEAKALMPKGHKAFFGEWQDKFSKWGKFTPNDPALVNELHYYRAWKNPYEIACMREASRLGALGHRAAYLAFKEETSEYDIHLAYCAACEHIDDQLPYGNIVALNQHAAILHYTYRDTQIVPAAMRKSFLIDAGAGYNGYASDITRTYSFGDDFFAELIDEMDRLQQIICDQVRADAHYPTLHLDTHRAIGGVLHNAGIVRCGGDDAAESGITSTFFPHGLGHYIGLQVHDVGGFMKDETGEHVDPPEGHEFLRLTRTVDTGQVMTIEPGVYFIESLLKKLKDSEHASDVNWSKVEELMPYGGIRIEDNVVVTDGEPENLTRDAFDAIAHHH